MMLFISNLPNLNVFAWLPVLLAVIIIHEFGHFIVARWCHIKVDTFSIGFFGPVLFSRHDWHGTRWVVTAVPLGGYVKFAGDDNAASLTTSERLAAMTPEQRKTAFIAKPLWQRAAVVIAGPMANFLSAILIFALVASVSGIPQPWNKVEVVADGAAARAGIVNGDIITSIDGTPIKGFSSLLRIVTNSQGRELAIGVNRDGQALTVRVKPQEKTVDDNFGGKDTRYMIGVREHSDRLKQPIVYPSIPGALWHGVETTWQIIADTVTAMSQWSFFQKVGGLPTMIDVSNKVATYGIVPLLQLTAILSVSIGFINLLPIPILDGGHLMFYAAEAVRGKPLSDRALDYGAWVGLVLVSSLMMLALWNDRFRVCRWIGLDCNG